MYKNVYRVSYMATGETLEISKDVSDNYVVTIQKHPNESLSMTVIASCFTELIQDLWEREV